MENVNVSTPLSESATETASRPFDPLNAIRLLRSAGGALCGQAELYGQLVSVEWDEEKRRLIKILIATVTGVMFLLCTLLFLGVLVLALSWDSPYRLHALLALPIATGLGVAIAWYKLQALQLLGVHSFAASRQEMAADIALLKSKL